MIFYIRIGVYIMMLIGIWVIAAILGLTLLADVIKTFIDMQYKGSIAMMNALYGDKEV